MPRKAFAVPIIALAALATLVVVLGGTFASPTHEAAKPSGGTVKSLTPAANPSPTPTHEPARHANFARSAVVARPSLQQYRLMSRDQGATLGQVELGMGGSGTRTAASTASDGSILERFTWSGTSPTPWAVSVDFKDGAMTSATESGLS